MYSTGSAELSGGQLTMAIIGCLPDNVQQVIGMYLHFPWLSTFMLKAYNGVFLIMFAAISVLSVQ